MCLMELYADIDNFWKISKLTGECICWNLIKNQEGQFVYILMALGSLNHNGSYTLKKVSA